MKLNRSQHWSPASTYIEARQNLPYDLDITYLDCYKKVMRGKHIYG